MANNKMPVLTDKEFDKPKGDRLVSSLPVRRQPNMNDNIDDEFFKLDEEEEEQQRRPVNYYTDDIDLADNDDAFLSRVEEEDIEEDIPRTESLIASSVPIDIVRPNHKTIDGIDGLAPLRKIDNDLNEENNQKLEEILSVREQTIFKNMQRLSFSVQPEDGPERLWGDHADWEDERRRRRCSFSTKNNETDGGYHKPADHFKFATTAPSNGPLIHTPKEAFILRPSHNTMVKTPGSIKKPGFMTSQPFGSQRPLPRREVDPEIHRIEPVVEHQLSSADRNDAESRHRTDTVDGVQRHPKM
ncbi:unnamed protein product [Bursaphelenchus xylophilus]|uniref:(pine wood nematode) hypothetical protein n=1 Tax=Bursaphelenchus xylophilus TaxID=6326 RepID=A0A1I7S034_BURXY|nr:unnamed protein product [Bursaphelenchus xylophilus]CAG9109048.1 unnamed protein product [Bursaphelenchus xylophilus]